MASLKDVKKRINTVRSTYKLISAMKLIAASRFRQSIRLLQLTRDYETSLARVLCAVVSDARQYEKCRQKLPVHFFEEIPSKPYVICVFGAQKGLCGNYNLASVKEAIALEARNKGRMCEFVPMTSKSAEYFTKHRPTQTEPLAGLGHFPKETTCMELATYVFEHVQKWYANDTVSAVGMVGGKFINTLTQGVESFDLFPNREIAKLLEKKSHRELVGEPEDKLKMESERKFRQFSPRMEPSPEIVVEQMLNTLALVRIYKAFLESETCEHAARMTMMDSSKRNAEELIDKLSMQYNRTRQANITNELIEIIAGTTIGDTHTGF